MIDTGMVLLRTVLASTLLFQAIQDSERDSVTESEEYGGSSVHSCP